MNRVKKNQNEQLYVSINIQHSYDVDGVIALRLATDFLKLICRSYFPQPDNLKIEKNMTLKSNHPKIVQVFSRTQLHLFPHDFIKPKYKKYNI